MPNTATDNAALRLGLALLAALAVIATALAVDAAQAARKADILGNSKVKNKPTCPKSGACQATGRVTGFQTALGGKKKIFEVPKTGHIVAWSVDLGAPDKESTDFFEAELGSKVLGSAPYGRIAVLKRKGHARFELAKQSPAVDLSNSLGERPVIALRKPLRVKKGRIIAFTGATWVPNYVIDNAHQSSEWLGSRNKKRCDVGDAENREKSKPHTGVGTTKKYGCRYKGQRILYWAYFVPKKSK